MAEAGAADALTAGRGASQFDATAHRHSGSVTGGGTARAARPNGAKGVRRPRGGFRIAVPRPEGKEDT